ncbi:myosin XVB [Rhynochetos jubatus]
MPPARSKARHKKLGKEKALNYEKKTNSPGDSKIHCERWREGKSKGQLKGKKSLPEQDDTLEENPLKSQMLVRPQGSKENGHKRLFPGKEGYKRNAKRECGLGRKHGEPSVSKLEGEKGKVCRQQRLASARESEDSSNKEEKATTNSKKHGFRRKCRKHSGDSENVTESESVKSIAVRSAEGCLQKHDLTQKARNARHREKHNENRGLKEASEKKSGSQSQGSMAQGKGERTGKKQVEKHTRIIVTESAEENILETSDNSSSESSSEGHWTHQKGTKETAVDSTASSEEKSSSSEEDDISEQEAMLRDPPVGEGKGYQELLDESNEATNEIGREQVTTERRKESEDKGTDFAGLEAEEKMKTEDDMPRQPESIVDDSSEEDDDVSISRFQLKSLKNRENGNHEAGKENILENAEDDMSKDAHDNSDSNGENSTEESTEKGKENAKQPLRSVVKAKIPVCLSRVLQGTVQEGKVDGEGSTPEDSPLLSKQQITLNSERCEIEEQGEAVGHTQRDSSSDCSKQELAAKRLTKKCSSQSQILLNLKNKHKNAETKLLTSCKSNPVQMALETNTDLKNAESICSKPTPLETLSAQKEPNIAQSFGEKRLNLSNISSCSTITKKSCDKQLIGKKKKVGKVIGKVKLSSGQTLEAKTEKAEVDAEAPSEKENVHDGRGSKYSRSHSAFRKVTSWLGQKPAKKASLKTRLLSVASAIGISRWLLRKFGTRKRSSKPVGFRSRVAIRIVSAAGWVSQSGKAFPGAPEQLGRAELSGKESSPPLVEGKDSPKTAEEVGHIDLPSDGSPLHGTSSFPYLLSLDEEKNNATDAKFAVVFPRVHSIVKTKSSLSRGTGNSYSLEKLRCLSDRKSAMPVQHGCRFKCDLPRSLMDQCPQGNSEQGFLPHREEHPVRTSDYSSEVDVKEGSGVLQTAGSIVTPCVHWSQQQAQGCDPAAWLNSELLLPRLTVENLSKWAIYKDPHLANSHVMNVCKDLWEAEDITDNMLEMEVMQKQAFMCEDHCVEVEEIEDLARLEEVCESSVLLCLKKRFHRNLIYTYIGQILVSVNPFKDLSIYSEDVAIQYHQGTLSKNAPHIFAIAEMAYTLSQTSEQEQCVIISGHSGSGKTEAAKTIVQYLTTLYQRSASHRVRQPCNVLPILESFGNARTILNDNSSRFGKLLNVHLRHGVVVGTSISQYLLEKSRVVFQAQGERNYHVFYELLAGLPVEQKEELYLQEAESYFYLNQGRACDILGKEDSQDFLVLVQALEGISLSDDQLTSTWAVLAAILQLGNICFTSYEKQSYEHAAIASETEIQIVANLLRVSADFLQSAVTHRVTVTSYDRIFTPLSVEGAIDARDSIAKTLYYLLFEWLLLRINEWLAPWESDCAIGIVDIHGFEDLGVNSLEQLCINFANEHLQHFFSQTVIAQEEEEYSREQLVWIPISKMYSESCLDFIAAKPHGILCILDDQTSLTQATDHTFLQKCHYHHGNSPWYTKPKLPLPVFTVKHYAGPVTYQVHKFLNKNRDQLRPEVLDIFSQSHLKVVSHIFQKAKAAYSQQRELGARGKGLKPQASTLVSKFQQSLQDLTAKLRRSHAFFIRCITPNPKKLSNVFDVEYVTCQLRHSGILEAIHIRKEGYPVRLPFQNFLARYGLLAGRGRNCLEGREGCAAVLSLVVGNPSDLYQIGVTKVFLKEKARQLLERQWSQRQSWAIVTLQRNFRCLLRRRRLRVLQEKVTIIQAHFRGYQARKRYRRLKKALVQFNTMILISRSLIQRRKHCQVTTLFSAPGDCRSHFCPKQGGLETGYLRLLKSLACWKSAGPIVGSCPLDFSMPTVFLSPTLVTSHLVTPSCNRERQDTERGRREGETETFLFHLGVEVRTPAPVHPQSLPPEVAGSDLIYLFPTPHPSFISQQQELEERKRRRRSLASGVTENSPNQGMPRFAGEQQNIWKMHRAHMYAGNLAARMQFNLTGHTCAVMCVARKCELTSSTVLPSFVTLLDTKTKTQKKQQEEMALTLQPQSVLYNMPNLLVDVGLLEIPAELAALLQSAEGQYQVGVNQITEALPPEVKVKDDLSLPPTINSYPFSSFIKSHFQKTDFPAPGQPLQHPLTRLDAEYQESALEINKLILRFIGDKNLHGWQEVLLGNYIAGRGLNNVALRNEIFSQVVAQTWKNPDMEHSQRAWVLMATLLSCFAPSPALEKPLLKFVSDHGMEGYNAVCQRKILTAAQHTEIDSTFSRAYPPTQLEWTANQRRGKMVLDVHTFNEEKFSAEVESWMTGEQYAGWLLSARGCDKKSRGWSVSMFTGNTWQDLLGCDFVLDLIGEMEEAGNPSSPSQSSAEYPISSERDRSFLQNSDLDLIPPAPGIQAPTFPPPSLPPEFSDLYADQRFGDDLRNPVGLDHYVDDLFSTVLHQGSRVPGMENRESLTGRMKGGGKIGPTQRGIFPSTGFPGMTQAPVYQPMTSVMGMPAAMPVMPASGGIAPMPAVVMPQPVAPAVDPNQLAAQQQAFINQQAMLMAQQMTLQAMSISQQQQQQQHRWQQSLENPRPRVSSPPKAQGPVPATFPKPKKPPSSQNAAPPPKAPEPPAKAEEPVYDYTEDHFSNSENDDYPRETFQQKREYFQKMGEQRIQVKKVRPPSKTWTPPANPQPNQEEEKEEEGEKRKEEKPSPKTEAAPAPPLPPPEPNPKKQTPKVKKESPVVKPSGPEPRPAPSREIRNIIKMYQSRPAPEPQPIEPVRRVSKPFMKKNDPKNEALAKLGMMNLPSPKSPSALPQEKRTPPPLKAKPGSASSSIKEKQLPLLSVFSQESTPPVFQAPPAPPPPPPLPSPLLPGNQDCQESTGKDSAVTVAGDEGIKTQLYKLTASVSFSYVNPAWKIFLRKEVFYPKENFSHPYCLNLLCEQIMRDTFSDSCLRISREEKHKMKDLLKEFRVGNDVQSIQEDGIKKRIVLAARDNWANYFSRLFPVHGENGSDVQILGVSHRGMRLLKVVKAAGYNPEHLKILRSYSFADVLSVELKGSNALEFSLKTEQLFLHSPKAPCIKAMVELFIQELRQDTNYVVALRSYITDDKSLLSFKKGDLIELLPMEGVEPGWQFGSTGGRSGLFPTSLVQLAAAPDYLSTSMNRHEGLRRSMKASPESRNTSRESSVPSLTSEPDSILLVPAGDHYTMMDFATAYFREGQSMQGLKGVSAEKKSAADLVWHTKVPIQDSLLQYSDSELNELATKNFKTLMRLMGDQPKLKNQNDVECIYEILQLCKEKESLHDEVYCQVIKQVTHNPNQESALRGWLLLNLLTGYFIPSNILMPYATKFLQLASSDPSSTHHDIAKICQSNLRKNFLYGGRRHLPFPVEIQALLKGCGARRLVIHMPVGVEYLTRIKTFTVAKELLQEICEQMGASEQEEIEDFVLFAIRMHSDNHNKMVRPIRSEEYLHDYLLEDNLVTVTLRRVTWSTPLHFDNKIYTDVHYGQLLWDYLNGRILLNCSEEMEMQVGILAMLQHWAKTEQQNTAPSREELKEYTPKTLQSLNPQTLQNHVGLILRTREPLQPADAKIQFIEHMMKLPLFGYNIYFVERVSDDTIPVPCFFGVNKEEIIVVDGTTQAVSCVIPLKELQKMRTMRPISDGGLPGIELNYGSATSPKTMWLELSRAKEMYHTIVVILAKSELHH